MSITANYNNSYGVWKFIGRWISKANQNSINQKLSLSLVAGSHSLHRSLYNCDNDLITINVIVSSKSFHHLYRDNNLVLSLDPTPPIPFPVGLVLG